MRNVTVKDAATGDKMTYFLDEKLNEDEILNILTKEVGKKLIKQNSSSYLAVQRRKFSIRCKAGLRYPILCKEESFKEKIIIKFDSDGSIIVSSNETIDGHKAIRVRPFRTKDVELVHGAGGWSLAKN